MSSLTIDQIKQVKRVIVHGGRCPDGRASAMILKRAFTMLKQDVSIEFVVHNSKEHEELEPEPGLLFADFCVPHDKVDDFVRVGTIVLDHHAGKEGANKAVCLRFVEEGLGAFGDEETDPGVSGAVLVFEHVFKPVFMHTHPKFDPNDILNEYEMSVAAELNAVENFAYVAGIRDTWQKKNNPLWIKSCEQAEALSFWPEDDLLDMGIPWSTLMSIGPTLWKKKMITTQKVAERAFHWTSSKGTRVAFFQGTKMSSDVAEYLDDTVDLVIGYDITYENEKVSMQFSNRSHTTFDCASFAAAHGGGGHTKAAGFRIILDIENDPNPYKVAREVLEAYECFTPKLVRDRIPEILTNKGVGHTTKVLTDDKEFKEALVRKVAEEAIEFLKKPSTEELGDVLEAVEALREFYPRLDAVRMEKRAERGGFEGRIVLLTLDEEKSPN